jgi:hypothetical protein
MKVEAYRCDYCGHIKEAEEIVGVSRKQDMFDRMKSFPVTNFPEREQVHYCTDCYNQHVIYVAEREVDRKRDEEKYRLKVLEMSYNLAHQCVANFDKKMSIKNSKYRK